MLTRFETRAARISRKNQEITEKTGDLIPEPTADLIDIDLCHDCNEPLRLDHLTGRHVCRLCGDSPY